MVSGAVYLPWLGIVSEPLTEMIHLVPLRQRTDCVSQHQLLAYRVAHLFRTLRRCLDALQDEYRNMRNAVKQVKDVLSPTPHYASFTSDGQSYRLTYRRNIADTYLSPQTVFRADATASDGTAIDCVVKFTSRYCDAAHRLMYEHGVAPRLLYCSFERTVGEYCVVMEYIQDTGRKIQSPQLVRSANTVSDGPAKAANRHPY